MSIAGAATVWAHATHGSPASNNDYSAKTMELSINFDGEEVDATCFNAASFRAFEQSFKSAEIEVTYKYDAAIGLVISDLYKNGTSVTFSLSPLGTSSTSPRIQASMICRTMELPFSVGELQQINATFRVTGEPDFTAHS
jgi:hypothetical protein